MEEHDVSAMKFKIRAILHSVCSHEGSEYRRLKSSKNCFDEGNVTAGKPAQDNNVEVSELEDKVLSRCFCIIDWGCDEGFKRATPSTHSVKRAR